MIKARIPNLNTDNNQEGTTMKNLVKARLVAVVFFISTGLVMAQTFNLYPDQVPKGAYVNGNDGDQQFIQTLKYTIGTTWLGIDGGALAEITITLPDSMNIANWDYPADTDYDDEVTIIDNFTGNITLGTVTSSSIELQVSAISNAAEWVEVTFPVETQSGASGSQNYTITFDDDVASETDGTVAVSYEDTLSLVAWEVDYAGNDDESSTLGDVYPAALASFFPVGGLDIVRDVAAATITGNMFFDAALNGGNDDGEALTYIWASQTPSLTRLNNMNAHRPWNVGLTARPNDLDGTETVGAVGNVTAGATYQFDASLLAEGIWFFYLTSGATGEWALATSDSVDIRHWPTFATGTDVAGGYDYSGDGIYTPAGGGGGDDLVVTLESGGTLGKDGGIVNANNLGTLDFFWDFQDLDDNAILDIFLSPDDGLTLDSVVVSGSDGAEIVTGIGSNSRKITSSSILEESATLKFTYDIYTDKTTYEPADDYYVYYVANDSTNQGVYQLLLTAGAGNPKIVTVKHYPYFKFDAVYVDAAGAPVEGAGTSHELDSGTDDYYVISWGQTPASGLGDGDLDADHNATITFYYTTSDLKTIIAATAAPVVTTVLDGNLETESAFTSAVTLIGSTTEDPDTKADNRLMWNFSAETTPLSLATDYRIIAHIQGGNDHLFVQLTTDLGPKDDDDLLAEFQDYDAQFLHTDYFRAETPLEGETIEVEGGDDLVIKWSGFDLNGVDDGLVQAIMAPAGTDITVLDVGAPVGVEWSEIAGATGYYWLFPTGNGSASSGANSGPSVASGTVTLDVSTLTTPIAGPAAVPSGFYDVYYFYVNDAVTGFVDELAVTAPGVLRFLGSSAAATNFLVTPNKSTLSKGETLTITVKAESPSANNVNILALALDIPSTYFTVVDQGGGEPFINEEVNFDGSAVLMNSMTNSGGYWQLDFVEVQSTPAQPLNAGPVAVASFQITVNSSGTGSEFIDNDVEFVNTATRTSGIVDENGNPEVVTLASPAAKLLLAPPGTIEGQVELEILPDPGQSVDIHVLPLGSFTPITDADFLAANGGANADGSVSVTLGTDGAYSVSSIPTGDYDILAHKDYHLDQLEQNVAVRPVTTTTVNFTAADMLLAGDIAGWDDDTDLATDSEPDNQVNTSDINAVANAFGSVPGGGTWNAAADFDADNYIYIADYNVVTTNSGTNGEGLLLKGIAPDANRNVIARLVALNQVGDEVTYAVMLENLSSLHAYAAEMNINSDHWNVLSYTDGMADYYRSANLYMVDGLSATFASGIIGRDYIEAKEMKLLTMTLQAKVNDPVEVSISSVTLVDGGRGLSDVILSNASAIPTEYALSQNFPNPFNPTTTINFSLPNEGQVNLSVYNLLGEEIATLASGLMDAGSYTAVWNSIDHAGRRMSTGMYFYRLMVDNRVVATKKMLLLK
jgi:hypothetical protein